MTKHKTMFVWGTIFSIVLPICLFYAMPGWAQSRADKNSKPAEVSQAASLAEAEKAGINTKQISSFAIDKVATETANAAPGSDTLFNCTWTAAAVYPAPVLDNAVASVGGNIYSFAGVSSGAIVATSNKFDGTTWTPIASYPVALEYPGAASDGTNIYIVGGSDGGGVSQTALNRYNVALNTYTSLAPCSVATWNHAFVYLNGKIYKIAGSNNTVSTTAVEIYDIAGNTWSAGAPYPLAVSFVNAFAQGNFIYAGGGIASVGSVESLKTYRYDPTANTWDDAAIADLPATRWGSATALYTDGVMAGGYSGGVIQNTVISWDLPSNTWQPVPVMLGDRARMNGAVLGGSFYVIGGRSTAVGGFTGTNNNQKLTCLNVPTNILNSGGRTVDSAGPNGAPDPGEAVSVSLGVLNVGGPGVVCTTSALTGTLLAGGGVTGPSGPQNYGAVCSGNPAVFRSFNFTVDPAVLCGSTVTATMHMQDGATDYGNITYTFVTGSVATSFAENFDGVVAPALPAGWTADVGVNVAGAPLWQTSNAGTPTPVADSAPNAAFSQDPANTCDNRIYTPSLMYSGGSQLIFRQNYELEENSATIGYDAGVLEISISGGAYTDIVTAGGSFAAGGYNHTGINTGFANPLLPSRPCWSGLTAGFVSVAVNLPAAGVGLPVQFRWRMGSDNSVSRAGWRVDNVTISQPVCGGNAPTVSSAVSRKIHGAFTGDINLPQVPLTGAVGIEDRRGAVAGEHQVVITFASPVTVGSASVTAGSIGSSSVVGAVVTLNLTGVANAQRLGVSLSNVSDGVNLGSVMIPMGALLGDTNANTAVNASDISQTKPRIGLVLDGTNFRSDVNVSGGINAGDVATIKSVLGTALP